MLKKITISFVLASTAFISAMDKRDIENYAIKVLEYPRVLLSRNDRLKKDKIEYKKSNTTDNCIDLSELNNLLKKPFKLSDELFITRVEQKDKQFEITFKNTGNDTQRILYSQEKPKKMMFFGSGNGKQLFMQRSDSEGNPCDVLFFDDCDDFLQKKIDKFKLFNFALNNKATDLHLKFN